jgi:hypothetical protein
MTLAESCLALHAAFVHATGVKLPYGSAWEFAWADLQRQLRDQFGVETVTPQDIRDVVAHRRAHRMPATLRIGYFVNRPDEFASDLAEAHARNRVPRPDPARADILRATGRPAAPEPPEARPAANIVQRLGDLQKSLKGQP